MGGAKTFPCCFEAKIQTVLIFIIELENDNIFYIHIKVQGDKELENVRFMILEMEEEMWGCQTQSCTE